MAEYKPRNEFMMEFPSSLSKRQRRILVGQHIKLSQGLNDYIIKSGSINGKILMFTAKKMIDGKIPLDMVKLQGLLSVVDAERRSLNDVIDQGSDSKHYWRGLRIPRPVFVLFSRISEAIRRTVRRDLRKIPSGSGGR